MLAVCSNKPFMPHRPDKAISSDLVWWKNAISTGLTSLSISPPQTFVDLSAFSDASSSIGVVVVISEHWRAWRLLPGWQTLRGQRDIAWAEAIGFEFLVAILAQIVREPSHIIAHGNNISVVESWWSGQHRNREINEVFKRIHSLVANSNNQILGVHTKYVPSLNKPADKPSRGVYGHESLLLPPVPIPQHFQGILVDFTAPITPTEIRTLADHHLKPPAAKRIECLKLEQEARERDEHLRAEQDELICAVLFDH